MAARANDSPRLLQPLSLSSLRGSAEAPGLQSLPRRATVQRLFSRLGYCTTTSARRFLASSVSSTVGTSSSRSPRPMATISSGLNPLFMRLSRINRARCNDNASLASTVPTLSVWPVTKISDPGALCSLRKNLLQLDLRFVCQTGAFRKAKRETGHCLWLLRKQQLVLLVTVVVGFSACEITVLIEACGLVGL